MVAQRVGRLVTLQLQVEVLPEDPLKPLDATLCLLDIPIKDVLGDLPAEASRGYDDALMVLLQQLLVDAGAVVVAIDPGARDHLDEVLVAGEVLSQQDEVPTAVVY